MLKLTEKGDTSSIDCSIINWLWHGGKDGDVGHRSQSMPRDTSMTYRGTKHARNNKTLLIKEARSGLRLRSPSRDEGVTCW